MHFQRVAIIGAGLIGGSFGLALKQAKACGHVVAVGRNPANMQTALERGAIDSVATDIPSAVSDCDLVLVAVPVAQFPKVFSQIAKGLQAKTLITDGGSTKRDVIEAARKALGAKIGQFVPAHPVAGAEASGAAAASAELFRDRRVILTPLAENNESAIEKTKAAWKACGARVSAMSAEAHDAVLAAVSHLPHLLAYALVHDVAKRDNSAQLFSFAAGGFRDFTRIASSHPEMWRDICMANTDLVLGELASFEKQLRSVRLMLEAKDADALEKLFTSARDARARWLKGEFDA